MDANRDDALAVKLAVIEVLDRDGHARLLVPAWRWPVVIGRAVDCDVVLDDVHAAPRHVTLAEQDGALTLQVGETVNGVQLPRRRLAAQQSAPLSPGEIFQVGNTRLRVRRAVDAVPPERPLTRMPVGGRLSVLGLLAAMSLWNAGGLWLMNDPDAKFVDYLPVLISVPVMLALWSGLWSVGSKLVRHRFDFWAHAHVALRYMLLSGILETALALAAFALGWAFLSRISGLVAMTVLWGMVLAHLTLIQPARRRLLAGVMAALLVAGVSLFLYRNYKVHDRIFTSLYVTTLAPPALRLAPTVPPARLIDEARGLKAVLDEHMTDGDSGDGSAESDQVSADVPGTR